MKRSCIVVPIYKAIPDTFETRSLQRCLEVFPGETIILVAPKHLQLQHYQELAKPFGRILEVEYFHPVFFKSISGYNNLLLSKQFYQRFRAYEFMLIHQLDVWVFSNQLETWCSKNYDYVGAPSFSDDVTYDPANAWIGNGGFSLRKIDSFLRMFDDERWFAHYANHSKHHAHQKVKGWIENQLLRMQATILKLGWTIAAKRINHEDYIWSHAPGWKIPNYAEAITFSFEKFPSKLYQETHQQLPFGCHAWQKYEYETFWKQFL